MRENPSETSSETYTRSDITGGDPSHATQLWLRILTISVILWFLYHHLDSCQPHTKLMYTCNLVTTNEYTVNEIDIVCPYLTYYLFMIIYESEVRALFI